VSETPYTAMLSALNASMAAPSVFWLTVKAVEPGVLPKKPVAPETSPLAEMPPVTD